MSTKTPPDLDESLASVLRPKQAPAMPRVSPLLALLTSPVLHRMLPVRLAVLVGEALGWVRWCARADVRERARLTMRAIVGGTERAREADRLARRFVIERNALTMLFWQPPARASVEERSRAHLQEALSSGRGILLSALHLGPFFDIASPLADLPRRVSVVSGGWFFLPPSPDYAGRRLAHWWGKIAERKQGLIPAGGSYATVRRVLEQGEIAVVYFDVPGSRETVFLGKPMSLASGTSRLAIETDALVLPARARRTGARVFVDFAAPLDSRRYQDAAQLHDALAQIHSALVLELAETLEDPRRTGAWEHGATAEAWITPHAMAAGG